MYLPQQSDGSQRLKSQIKLSCSSRGRVNYLPLADKGSFALPHLSLVAACNFSEKVAFAQWCWKRNWRLRLPESVLIRQGALFSWTAL